MAKKTALIKAPPKPRTADDFVVAGREPAAAPGGRMKRLTLDVPLSLHKRIKKESAEREEPMADVLRAILEREFPA